MSEQTMSRRVRAEIRAALRDNNSVQAILVEVHPAVAAVLIGAGGSNLRKIEEDLHRSIYVRGAESCHMEEMRIVAMGRKAEVERLALPVHERDILEVRIEEQHVSNPKDGIARVEGYVLDIEDAGQYVGQEVNVEVTKAYRTYAKAKVVS